MFVNVLLRIIALARILSIMLDNSLKTLSGANFENGMSKNSIFFQFIHERTAKAIFLYNLGERKLLNDLLTRFILYIFPKLWRMSFVGKRFNVVF